MKYNNLSTTNIKVSKVCLGTMSFGAHISEEKSFEIMDKAFDLGINFFDTAEIYPAPPCEETYGLTENIIGKWIKNRGIRDEIILATKIAGPSRGAHGKYIREGKSHFDKKNLKEAIEGSLKRLNTDFIDLYQLHWPDRNINKFGQRAFIPRPFENKTEIEETLEALLELQKEGKVKNFGLSNESPWGTINFLQAAKEKNLPRMVSVQNNYSLLTRTFDTAMAEVSMRENIGLLAYSPLGFGVLGGKYLNGNFPENGRLTKYPDFAPKYKSKFIENIIKKYKNLAEKNGITVAELALAFVYSRKFLTSCIIGPSNISQLEENVNAMNIKLTPEIFDEIDKIQEECPNPCA